jgi:hypothetical protein
MGDVTINKMLGDAAILTVASVVLSARSVLILALLALALVFSVTGMVIGYVRVRLQVS